jgi:hypothetical protein
VLDRVKNPLRGNQFRFAPLNPVSAPAAEVRDHRFTDDFLTGLVVIALPGNTRFIRPSSDGRALRAVVPGGARATPARKHGQSGLVERSPGGFAVYTLEEPT